MTTIRRDDLDRYLLDHPGTEGLRELREALVQRGVPVDQLDARGRGPRRNGPPTSTNPADRFVEYMEWVCNTDRYQLSNVPRFVANGATVMFASCARPDGTITSEDVALKLGPMAAKAFALLARELTAQRAGKPPVGAGSTAKLPPNALTSRLRPPDLDPIEISAEVMRRLRPQMMVVDLNQYARHRAALEARNARRDPVNRVAAVMDTPAETPRVPALESLRAEARQTKPLRGAKLFCLQHLYASTKAVFDAAVDAGIRPEDAVIMGKPYSGSMRAVASMLQAGYNVVLPSLRQSELAENEAYSRSLIKEQLTNLLDRSSKNAPILVIDDGGQVATVVKQLFPQEEHRFRFVEQTQHGANVVRELAPNAPVVDVAESFAKKVFESPCIAWSVFKEMGVTLARLEAQGAKVPHEITLLGFGSIGSAVAANYAKAGWKIHVYDPSPDRQEQARKAGYAVHADKAEALKAGHVTVGASGHQALSLDDLKLLPDGAVLFNAASANSELNANTVLTSQLLVGTPQNGTIMVSGRGLRLPRECLVQMDTAVLDEEHRLWDMFQGKSVCLGVDESATQIDRVVHTEDGKSLYFARSGFVVNLTADDDPIPPRYIGLTRALLFGALLQAATASGKGLVELDHGLQDRVLAETQAELAKTGEKLESPRF